MRKSGNYYRQQHILIWSSIMHYFVEAIGPLEDYGG